MDEQHRSTARRRPASEDPGDSPGAAAWVRFEGEVHRLSPGQSALDALCAGGADVAYSCRRGVCRTCLLEAVSGEPGAAAQAPLPAAMREAGAFLACLCTAPHALEARRPDPARYRTAAMLAERTALGGGVHRLSIEPETVLDWHPGQCIAVQAPGGRQRHYAVLSRPDDYFIDILVEDGAPGTVGHWLAALAPGEDLAFTGPLGACHAREDEPEAGLALLGAGIGAGAAYGIARDALVRGHRGEVRLALVARTGVGLLAEEAEALAAAHANLRVLRPGPAQAATALAGGGDLSDRRFFLCGAADLVEGVRAAALAGGALPGRIEELPFAVPDAAAPEAPSRAPA